MSRADIVVQPAEQVDQLGARRRREVERRRVHAVLRGRHDPGLVRAGERVRPAAGGGRVRGRVRGRAGQQLPRRRSRRPPPARRARSRRRRPPPRRGTPGARRRGARGMQAGRRRCPAGVGHRVLGHAAAQPAPVTVVVSLDSGSPTASTAAASAWTSAADSSSYGLKPAVERPVRREQRVQRRRTARPASRPARGPRAEAAASSTSNACFAPSTFAWKSHRSVCDQISSSPVTLPVATSSRSSLAPLAIWNAANVKSGALTLSTSCCVYATRSFAAAARCARRQRHVRGPAVGVGRRRPEVLLDAGASRSTRRPRRGRPRGRRAAGRGRRTTPRRARCSPSGRGWRRTGRGPRRRRRPRRHRRTSGCRR